MRRQRSQTRIWPHGTHGAPVGRSLYPRGRFTGYTGLRGGSERWVTHNLALSPPSPVCQLILDWLTLTRHSGSEGLAALYNLALTVHQAEDIGSRASSAASYTPRQGRALLPCYKNYKCPLWFVDFFLATHITISHERSNILFVVCWFYYVYVSWHSIWFRGFGVVEYGMFLAVSPRSLSAVLLFCNLYFSSFWQPLTVPKIYC